VKIEDQSFWNARKQVCQLGRGRALAFLRSGSFDQPFLFVHGFSDSSRSFSLLAPYLAGASFVIPDLIGHGQSARPAHGYDLDAISHDLAQFITANFEVSPIIVGHSLGAMAALRLASRHPALVRALVMLSGALQPLITINDPLRSWVANTADPINPDDPFFESWHQSTRPLDSAFLAHVRSEASAIPIWLWKTIIDEFDRVDLTHDAKNLKVATLMISGKADPLFGEHHRNALAAAINPARHELMDLCGHNPHWEYPAEVAAILREFSASLRDTGQTNRPGMFRGLQQQD
jgi:pimeloyl-ACP methyl ester carboxylesterase